MILFGMFKGSWGEEELLVRGLTSICPLYYIHLKFTSTSTCFGSTKVWKLFCCLCFPFNLPGCEENGKFLGKAKLPIFWHHPAGGSTKYFLQSMNKVPGNPGSGRSAPAVLEPPGSPGEAA